VREREKKRKKYKRGNKIKRGKTEMGGGSELVEYGAAPFPIFSFPQSLSICVPRNS
jgi:hypothetical protein